MPSPAELAEQKMADEIRRGVYQNPSGGGGGAGGGGGKGGKGGKGKRGKGRRRGKGQAKEDPHDRWKGRFAGPAAQSDHDVYIKLLLLGDSGVGKTSVMLRYADDKFSANLIATAGVDFKIKYMTVAGKRVKCQIWDTAGQERFHVITRSYYKGAHGIVLVYDVTDAKTFKNVGYWMNNIQQHAKSGVARVLLGNKVDLADKRQTPTEEGQAKADEYGMPFYETSAKSGVKIDDALRTVVKEIVQRQIELAAQSAANGGGAGGKGGGKGGGKADLHAKKNKGQKQCVIL